MRNKLARDPREVTPLLFAIFVIVVVMAVAHVGIAQSTSVVRQVADLNPGANGSFPSNMTVFNGTLYFSAYTVATGRELWAYDGRSITLVSNINDTVRDIGFGTFVGNDSNPHGFTVFNGALYFSAFDPRRGGELWRTDGTHTFRAADINPDRNDLVKPDPASSWPGGLTVLDDGLYFSAYGGLLTNYELWKYDGAAATLAANIHPDGGMDSSSYPQGLCAFSGALYFSADDGINGFQLWKYAGLASTLMNLNPGGTSSSYPKYFTPLDNYLYFQAFQTSYGYELCRTDGTNVSLASDINPGTGSSFPEGLTVFQGALYFMATDGITGYQLWKHDGSSASLVSRINPAGDAFPKNFVVFKNQLYFAADDGTHGWELWKCDGATASLVTDLNPVGDSFPESLTVLNSYLYFVATTPDTGYELWKYDGTNVVLAADINPGPGSSYPQHLAVFGSELCFSAAADGFSDWELWSLTEPNTSTLAPVTIVTPRVIGNDFIFAFSSSPGATYQVQTMDLSQVASWQPVGTINGDGSPLSFTNALLTGGQRLYRVLSK
jgi:ELWxxDGT repeat protein